VACPFARVAVNQAKRWGAAKARGVGGFEFVTGNGDDDFHGFDGLFSVNEREQLSALCRALHVFAQPCS
jgi:hypothetical protein